MEPRVEVTQALSSVMSEVSQAVAMYNRRMLTVTAFPQDIVNNVISRPFGVVSWYTFNDTFNIGDTVNSITIANSYTEAINRSLFILPSQSFQILHQPTAQFLVRAAVCKILPFSQLY